jgi:hypothetical protein
MAVTVTKSNATVPTIVNDDYVLLPANNFFLFSVYQGTAFSMDLTFALFEGSEEFPTPAPIASITPSFSTYSSVTFTTIDTDPYAYKIRVQGNLTNVIVGESYDVLQEDRQIVQVPVSELPPKYAAIVEWNLPTFFSAPVTINNYSFAVVGNSMITETVTMSQYVYWNAAGRIAQFEQAVAGGS